MPLGTHFALHIGKNMDTKLFSTQPTTRETPRLVSAKKKPEKKGLSAYANTLQSLFVKKSPPPREVAISPFTQVKNSFVKFFRRSLQTETKEILDKPIENKTEVYSLLPSRKYIDSLSHTHIASARKTPEYLVREGIKESLSPLNNEKTRCLFANVHLDLHGTLRKQKNGLVYLTISEQAYAHLREVFHVDGFIPPDTDLRMGHSIPVIFPQEKWFGSIDSELGKTFSFFIKRAYIVTENDWPGVDKTLILTVGSQTLSALRSKHVLPEKPLGREFHITLGIHRCLEKQKEKGFMRVHVGYHPV